MNKKLGLLVLVGLMVVGSAVQANKYPTHKTLAKVVEAVKTPLTLNEDKVVASAEVVFLATVFDVVRRTITDKEEMVKFVKAFFTPWKEESIALLKEHKILAAELFAMLVSFGTLGVEGFRDKL